VLLGVGAEAKEEITHMWSHVEAQQEFCFDLIQESD
jgi:hypothetical protein